MPSQPVSTANLQYLRDQFPGNKIPSQRLDPVAQKALSFYPDPNTDVGPFFRNNFFINSPETNVANGMIGKVDHSFLERHRVSTELAFSNGLQGAAKFFPNVANPGPVDRNFSTRRGSLEHVLTLSSRTVNNVTFEATTEASRSGESTADLNAESLLGLHNSGGGGFPLFQLGAYLPMGKAFPTSRNTRNVYSWTDALSTKLGKHSIRFTGEYDRYQVNTFWPQYPAGSYRFSAGLTSLPGIINTGSEFASFVLGLADFGERSIIVSPSYFRRGYLALGVADQYEIRKGLSISVRLTFARNSNRREKFDRPVHRGPEHRESGKRAPGRVDRRRPERSREFFPARAAPARTKDRDCLEPVRRYTNRCARRIRSELYRNSDVLRAMGHAGLQRVPDIHLPERAIGTGRSPFKGTARAGDAVTRSAAGCRQRHCRRSDRPFRPCPDVSVRFAEH